MASDPDSSLLKQHLIDPEICIRCHTCEMNCPIGAITHNDVNVVVDAEKCDGCLNCIPVCPTGSIDNWRMVASPYALEDQLEWDELPEQQAIAEAASEAPTASDANVSLSAMPDWSDTVQDMLDEAHSGVGGAVTAPASAALPTTLLYTPAQPAIATVKGNFRLTADSADSDVRHIILDFGNQRMPVLEGQSIGIHVPGTDEHGRAHFPRLYSVSSPRDGERPGYNNLSLTVKREDKGVCSNYLCDLALGDTVTVSGPFGTTFLMPEDHAANILMICTGTGSAPFRAFTMHRQRSLPDARHSLKLFFGARTPDTLPYFGPLGKVPESVLDKHLVFSRVDGEKRNYVQDELLACADQIAELLTDPNGHVFICGLKAMEEGVEQSLKSIADMKGLDWRSHRAEMRDEGRFHIETY